MLQFVLLLAMISCAFGHAVMTNPVPLNPDPTTSQPCGVTAYPTDPSPSALWVAGQQYTIGWQLIATDGGTTVMGEFDPTGEGTSDSSFTIQAWSTPFQMSNGLAKYAFTFTMPTGVSCSSSSTGLCLFRMYTNTNWNSCIFVNVSTCADCPQPPPPPPVCKTATGLTFCNQMNNQGVYVAADADPTVIDANTRNVFWAAINNTNVFSNGTSEICRQDYLTFLCASNLPPCPGSNETLAVGSACESMCTNVTTACQLTTIHKNLYVCNTYPLCPGETPNTATKLFMPIVFVVVIVALALLF